MREVHADQFNSSAESNCIEKFRTSRIKEFLEKRIANYKHDRRSPVIQTIIQTAIVSRYIDSFWGDPGMLPPWSSSGLDGTANVYVMGRLSEKKMRESTNNLRATSEYEIAAEEEKIARASALHDLKKLKKAERRVQDACEYIGTLTPRLIGRLELLGNWLKHPLSDGNTDSSGIEIRGFKIGFADSDEFPAIYGAWYGKKDDITGEEKYWVSVDNELDSNLKPRKLRRMSKALLALHPDIDLETLPKYTILPPFRETI